VTAKLVSNPPQGSGLVPSIVDRHYADLTQGKPGELLVAGVVLQPVGTSSRRTKDGIHTTTTYEIVRLEVMRDSHDADHVSWLITRHHDLRHGGDQQTLPLNSPVELRDSTLAALREWAEAEGLSEQELDERFQSYFGGPEHASAAVVKAGSLVQLREFAFHVGAVEDPQQGHDPDDDGFGAGDEPGGDDRDERLVPQPAFSSGGSA
jgi:hypothetical protein